jgi:hypothetical protein
MKRSLLAAIAAVVAAVFAGLGAGTAGAAPPKGGCPPTFTLITLQDLAPILGLTLDQVEAIPGIDTNNDGWTCYKQEHGHTFGLDNVVP